MTLSSCRQDAGQSPLMIGGRETSARLTSRDGPPVVAMGAPCGCIYLFPFAQDALPLEAVVACFCLHDEASPIVVDQVRLMHRRDAQHVALDFCPRAAALPAHDAL